MATDRKASDRRIDSLRPGPETHLEPMPLPKRRRSKKALKTSPEDKALGADETK